MKTQKCKHRKTWLIADGFWEWCYQCGAIRLMRQIEGTQNGLAPAERWTRPTGFPDGTNPALKSRKERGQVIDFSQSEAGQGSAAYPNALSQWEKKLNG